MRVGPIDLDKRVLIVAEAGNNHEGDFGRAQEMVAAAAQAGADAIKFQTIVPERLVAPTETVRLAQLRRFAFNPDQFAALAESSARAGIMFMSTPFDIESVAMLNRLVPAFKVASGDNDWPGLLRAVARTNKPILLSSGLAAVAEITVAKSIIESEWAKAAAVPGLAILHCVSAYPAEPKDANLGAIRALAALGTTVGYSDHTLGIQAAIVSVGLGARAIEKHFTLDKKQSDFRDHKLSSDPAEFADLVRGVRNAEVMLGEGEKKPLPCEAAVAAAARRSLHVTRDLPAGTVIADSDLICLRPSGGIRAADMDTIIGRRLVKPIAAGSRLEAADLG